MIKKFLSLEWKSFFRSPSFTTNLVLKILQFFGIAYLIFIMGAAGLFLFFGLEKAGFEPLATVNKFLIYYLVGDLAFKYMAQKMPIVNIKPLLLLPYNKPKIVNYALGKTMLSWLNWYHAFLFIPFSGALLLEGYSVLNVLGWLLALIFLIYLNNFINIFLNDKKRVLIAVVIIVAGLGALQYYEYFDITKYTGPVFQAFYEQPWLAAIPLLAMLGVGKIAHTYFLNRLYLDAGLARKVKTASNENLDWIDRFGSQSTFLKNDLRMIIRNKRSKTTAIMSVLFLFYGLLFFTGAVETYDGPFWRMFAAVFVTGGFLFMFGQFVPSWDSAYYPLMMTQNIQYKEYLRSKWWLMIIATGISTVLAIPYLYFGWEVLVAIIVGAIFNMGINAHLVLWGGAYIKTPVDLESSKKAFGDKSSFNLKTMLLSLPKMLGPMALYAIGHFTVGPWLGFVIVALAGVAGFAFRDMAFNRIIKIYKTEKYKTLAAYKQKN